MSRRTTGRLFVAVQAALIVGLALVPRADHVPTPTWVTTVASGVFWLGVALALVAALTLGTSLTATPVPRDGGSLRTGGPYRWVRHPIYTGVILIVAAMAVRSGNVIGLVLGAVTIVFFHVKAGWEERRLAERFDGYAEYAGMTPRFIPRPPGLRRITGGSGPASP